jgi:Filamentation induced by cAMP protein Fic-like, C-terminal domain
VTFKMEITTNSDLGRRVSACKRSSSASWWLTLSRIADTSVSPHQSKRCYAFSTVQRSSVTRRFAGKWILKDRAYVREHYIDPAIALGLIEMTIPDKPNSRLQKYRLTDKGNSGS